MLNCFFQTNVHAQTSAKSVLKLIDIKFNGKQVDFYLCHQFYADLFCALISFAYGIGLFRLVYKECDTFVRR